MIVLSVSIHRLLCGGGCSSIPPVEQHYDDMLSIHSSTICLHLSSAEEQPTPDELERMASSGSATAGGGSGDVVIVVNATDNEEDDEEMEVDGGGGRRGVAYQQHLAAAAAVVGSVGDGSQQLAVDMDPDTDYLGDSPKRGYRSGSSGEIEDQYEDS